MADLRKRIVLAATLLLLGGLSWAQSSGSGGNTLTSSGSGTPSGSCAFLQLFVKSDGTLYDCPAGTWNAVNPSGGGTGTVTQVNTGTGLTGGPITTTGTIALATNTANTLLGFDGSGNPGDVTIGTGLALSGGVLSATASGGTVTSVGLTVNGTSPSGILTVTGSPVTTSGTLNFNLAGTSGGLPYFSSASVLSSSGAMASGQFVLGGGAGSAPTTSFSVVPVANGGTATGSTLVGLARGGNPFTAAEISGDCTTSGSNAITCTKTSGVAFVASATSLTAGTGLNGTAFSGTSGHLVSFGAANIPADSGVVAADVITYHTPAAGIALTASGTQAITAIAAVGSKCYPFQGSGGTGCDTPTGTGTVTSVGLTVNATSPSGIFTVTGSPVTGSGTLNFNLAGTSGGFPYFSSSTVLSSTGAGTTHGVWLAQGAGNAPTTTGAGTTGQCLTSNGASSDPTYQTCGVGAGVTSLTGDGVLISNSLSTGAVTLTQANAAGGTIFGNNTSSSAAPVFSAAPVLGVDNTTAGTLQMANGSSVAHTIWGSAATTTNTIKGFATVPTTGHVVDCTVASTTCTLHDSGLATANVVLSSSPGAGIAHFAGSTQTVTSSAVNLANSDVTGTLPQANIAVVANVFGSGTITIPSGNAVLVGCTSTCSVPVPVPVAGYQICIKNTAGVTTAITLSALGSSASYPKADDSGYGTAGTGTMVSNGSSTAKVCLFGKDSTHYELGAIGSSATWTVN